jgi:hypothetical protein
MKFSGFVLAASPRGEKDFEAAIGGRLVNTMLSPHERTPSWEGEDIFSVCDVLPFPKFLKAPRTTWGEWDFSPTAPGSTSGNPSQTGASHSGN